MGKPTELAKTIASIEKKGGEGTVRKGGDIRGYRHMSTDSFLLDYALLGGITEGNGTMIFGHENCSKTTMLYKIMAGHQRKYFGSGGEYCALVDCEDKYDADWASKMGVDLDKLLVVKPPMGEGACDAIEELMRTIEVGLVCLDSVAALLPRVILDKSAEDPTVGERARLVGLLCTKLQQAWIDESKRDHHPTFLATNQWRQKVGVFFGDTRVLPGGTYQHFMFNTKLELRMKGYRGGRTQSGKPTTKISETTDGVERLLKNTISFKISKLKHGFSITGGEFDMVMDDPEHPFGLTTGWVDDARVVATYAKRDGLVTGGGGAFRLPDCNEKFPTLDSLCEYFYTNPEIFTRTKQLLIAMKRVENGLPGWPKDDFLLDWKE